MLTMDRARRCELARRGRERAESVYGWPVVARQHLDFFERVIASRAVMSALRVALCADFPEERWPSMDRVANELVAHLRRSHSDAIDLTPVCPPFARRATRLTRSGPLHSRSIVRSTGGGTIRVTSRGSRPITTSFMSSITAMPSSFTICPPRSDRRHLPRPRHVPLGAEAGGRAAIGAVPEGDAPDSDRPSAGRLDHVRQQRRSATSCSASASSRRSVSASCRSASARGFRPTPTKPRIATRRGSFGARAGAIELLHVGSTIARKRIDALLAICAALVPRVPDLHLVRVGGPFTPGSSG